MLPSGSQATSVGCRKRPSTCGSGGLALRSCGWASRSGRLRLAAEHHLDTAVRIELDDHVGALVGRPDSVVLVDPDRMRIGPGVEILADLANEGAVTIELEDLRGRVAEGWPLARAAARVDENMPFGIDRHARHLAEMQVGRKLQQVGNGLVGNFRHRLLCAWRLRTWLLRSWLLRSRLLCLSRRAQQHQ